MALPNAARRLPWLAAGGAAAAALSPAGAALAEKGGDKKAQGPLFDPEALERGAKALREINASPHAKQARRPAGGCGGPRQRARRWQLTPSPSPRSARSSR
jgi:hypothetical protein